MAANQDAQALAETVEVGDLPARRQASPRAASGTRVHGSSSPASEDVRAFQERVALMAVVGTVLSALALLIFVVRQLVAGGAIVIDIVASRLAHVTAIAVTGIAWLTVRKKPRSMVLLRLVEAATMLCLVVCFAMMASTMPRYVRPEMVAALITLIVTLVRAILVPSSPLRTLVLTSIAWLPTYLLTFVMFRHVGIRVDDGTLAPYLARALTETTTWSVLGTTLVTVTSRVIYGLQREVREDPANRYQSASALERALLEI